MAYNYGKTFKKSKKTYRYRYTDKKKASKTLQVKTSKGWRKA